MPEDLLRTKLTVPRIRPSAVVRPRLLACLDDALPRENAWQRQVTLISAPAGFGKTTLLCQWLDRRGTPTAWVSLDEADNDPARFLAYVVAALKDVGPQISVAVLDPLRSSPITSTGARSPLETALIGLLNEMATVADPYVLVFDDYQAIESTAIHEVVSFLLENQPPQLHVAITTRVDPPLPVARLRAQAQLTEIHAAELCFTLEETTAFFNDVMELSLPVEHLAALEKRTEGWIAGLQLAALALSGAGTGARRKGVAAFVEAFSGSHRFVLDYLTEEVLSQQSAERQDFLLRTSVLERLNAPLCEALTGRADSQQVLEALDMANLFILPLDGERRWYRYHHLFADLLRQRLQREGEELARDLHRRASAWYEKQGWLPEAVQHALAADDFAGAASLIEENGWAMLMRGEMNTLLRWLEALPGDFVAGRPRLGILGSWALAYSGQWERVESVLAMVDRAEATGQVAAVRAYVAAVQGDVSRTRDLAQRALKELPDDEDSQRALVTFCLAITYFSSGRPRDAARTLAEVIRLADAAGQPHLVMTATAHLGHVYEMQGQLQRALEKHREALQMPPGTGGNRVPFHGIAHVGIAEVLYERDDLESALHHAKEGVRLTELGGFTSYMLAGYATLVRVCQARGDWPGSEETLREAQQIAEAHRFPYMQGVFAELRVRQWIAQGKLAALRQWREARAIRAERPKSLAGEIERLALARALIGLGATAADAEHERLAAATELLARLAEAAEEAGRIGSAIRILALQSVAYHRQRARNSALQSLALALSLADPQGYVRSLVDEGAAMEELLREALRDGLAPSYCATLLAAFSEEPGAETSATAGLVEPLSEREVEVLRLIAAGLSNREIAEELVIAISTVKSHINNMYGKLGVKSRTQAVARSQDLGLL